MNNENKSNSSNLPLIIIGLVLVAALVGFWWLYSGNTGSPSTRSNTNKKDSSANTAELYAKASPGANPPHALGSPSAPVTIEEFADFQCPECARMHPVVKEVRAAYGDRVRVIFRQFPLNIPTHDKAYEAAAATEAAGLQGRFWEMQNLLFTNQNIWSRSADHRKIFAEYAQKIGLDVDKFTSDMVGFPAKTRVDADIQRGRSLNVGSTPTFYINGKLFDPASPQEMSVEGMRRVIDAELQRIQPK